LVSAGREPSPFIITGVAGHSVKHCNQLNDEVERVVAAGKPVQVALLAADAAPNASPTSINLEPPALVALSQLAAPEPALMRITEDGNPWILLRQDGVRCKIMARVERSRGLLQLIISLGVCWGPQVLLPAEIQASCDGRPLQCLTAADTLELLYGAEHAKT